MNRRATRRFAEGASGALSPLANAFGCYTVKGDTAGHDAQSRNQDWGMG
jgi:hypothetical protein